MTNPSLPVWRLILISLFALAGLSPVRISAWKLDEGEIKQVKPSVAITQGRVFKNPTQAEISGESFCLFLVEMQAALRACDQAGSGSAWISPDTWQVKEAFFADLNLDGNQEATLLVRRPYKPWPVDQYLPHGGRTKNFQDEKGFSYHIILIGFVAGEFREVWAGSAMVNPARQVFAADLDGDGGQELAALQYRYNEPEVNGSLVIWKWSGFSFSQVSRVEGPFSQLNLLQGEGRTWMLTQ